MFNFTGGMLTGQEIERQIRKGNIRIDPYDPDMINPNSYNLRLHPELLVYSRGGDRKELLPKTMPKSIEVESKVNDSITNGSEDSIIIKSATIDPLRDLLKTPTIMSLDRHCLDPIDMKKSNDTIRFTIPEEGYTLQPGIVYIGRTVESTASDKYIPMINGRSSGGRLGISIHVCAGFGDIGFDGTWTLEITCVEPVTIYPNVEIAQVCYFKPYGKRAKLYRGRYQCQVDATPSRFYQPKRR